METPTIKPRRKGRSGMQAMLIPSPWMVAEAITAAPEGMVTALGALGDCSRPATARTPAAR
jgi:hypothetical protein